MQQGHTLFELYQQMAHDALYYTGTWDHRLPREVQNFADNVHE
jgi:hypothetical protein